MDEVIFHKDFMNSGGEESNLLVDSECSKENKKRYVKFACSKCKNEVHTDIPAETIEASIEE